MKIQTLRFWKWLTVKTLGTHLASDDGLNGENLSRLVVLQHLSRQCVTHPRVEPHELPLEQHNHLMRLADESGSS